MEWLRPISGDSRVVNRFAFLPIEANGKWRWFRKCIIHQSYDTSKDKKWSNDWFED